MCAFVLKSISLSLVYVCVCFYIIIIKSNILHITLIKFEEVLPQTHPIYIWNNGRDQVSWQAWGPQYSFFSQLWYNQSRERPGTMTGLFTDYPLKSFIWTTQPGIELGFGVEGVTLLLVVCSGSSLYLYFFSTKDFCLKLLKEPSC